MPKFPTNFTGTGDLFAALLMAWMTKSNNNLKVRWINEEEEINNVMLNN